MPTLDPQLAALVAAPEPWVAYNAMVDLQGRRTADREVRSAYTRLRESPQIAELIAGLDPWPPLPSKGAYAASEAIWKLATLADLGLRRDDPRVAAIAERVLAAQASDGGFLQGGFDHTRTWDTRPYICVSHVMTYALSRFGYGGDPRVRRAYAHITERQRLDGGWHPNELLQPGQKREAEPSCPFGTVNVLRALVADPQLRWSTQAKRGAEMVLECWSRRGEPYRPVGFGMGRKFGKLQFPFVQHQLLKTLDVLSRIPSVRSDPRFVEMRGELAGRRDQDGTWRAEGTAAAYAGFDFAQKKTPSRWITLVALRILAR